MVFYFGNFHPAYIELGIGFADFIFQTTLIHIHALMYESFFGEGALVL